MRDWRSEVRSRVAGGGLDPRGEHDVVEELAQHLEDRYAELCARGAAPQAAAAEVLRELDADPELGATIARNTRPLPAPDVPIGVAAEAGVLTGLLSDVRVALRLLRRSPAFTLVTALLIALGIGATTVVFSGVNALLLRPWPGVLRPDELVQVFTSDYSGPRFGQSSYPDFEAIREAGIFADVAASQPRPFSVRTGAASERVLGEVVSPEYFRVLGVAGGRGRLVFEPRADTREVVISDALWRSRFGGDHDVIGRPLQINGQALTIVGVAPATFRGSLRGVRVDVWVPATAPQPLTGFERENRGDRGLFITGRLRIGSDVERAQAALSVLAGKLHAEYADAWTDHAERSRVLTAVPESEARVPVQLRTAVLGVFALLLAVVGIVLLIACSNVANLMLARASQRRSEMGVRIAIGATRGRIVRHLLTESLLIALLGGGAGLLLAYWLVRSLAVVPLTMGMSLPLDINVDTRVVLFAMLVSAVTAVLFGIAPALHSTTAPSPLIRGTGYRAGMRLRNALVVVQVTASLALLVGGSLFLRTLLASDRIDPGFDPENMVLVQFALSTEGLSDTQAQQFLARAEERVAAIPGVRATTLARMVPLGLGFMRRGVAIEGYSGEDGSSAEVAANGVGPEYFRTMGIGIVKGRAFNAADRDGAPPVVIVNEAFVRQYFGGGNALGRRISMSGPEGAWMEVIGVAADGKYRSLAEEPLPYFYYPYLQDPAPDMTLQVRTAGDPSELLPVIRRELQALAPAQSPPNLLTLRQHMGLSQLPQRIAASVLAVLGALALLIAGIGLYGVIAFSVAQRRREIGVRMALGASTSDVRGMVVRQGLRLALVGIAIGVPVAAVLARLLEGQLLVSAADPVSFGGVALLLIAVAALASYIPARRATTVDPLLPLRES